MRVFEGLLRPPRSSKRKLEKPSGALPLKALAALASLVITCGAAEARITRLEILKTEPAFGGQSFGEPGVYQRIFARAYGEVDPADPQNAVVQDLNLAPRNAKGMVEYSTFVELLRPLDMARGNRILLFEVANRGNKLVLGNLDAGVPLAARDRNALNDPGDGHLMREGYTLIWYGWQQDVLEGWGRILMPEVTAHNPDGSSVTGTVRSEMVALSPTPSLPIAMSWQVILAPPDSYDAYPAVSTDNHTPLADGFLPTLTVRAREQDPRVPIPNSEWSFGTCETSQPVKPDPKHLCLASGFKPGHFYELIYRAKDPLVLGLGFVATRDLGAFLRDAEKDESGTANPVYRQGQRNILIGSSQSGRMIRSFIQLGFNRTENGLRAFDGAYAHIGGGLIPLNVRFGQPTRAWGEQPDHLYPAYDFPFSYARQRDPITGRQQGLLDECMATDTCPRIFHVATALEMWEARQSLGLTDPLGHSDVPDPANVRTFVMASTQHGAAALPLATKPPFGFCQQQPNPNPQLWTMRALLSDLVQWVRDGVEPPASVVPRIADGTLVGADQVHFPPIPANNYGGVERPAVPPERVTNALHLLDFGPLYRPETTSGIITVEPPRPKPDAYGVLVPNVDADGNDIGGLRSVFLEVPIGTYTGWNLYRKGIFENGLCNLQGSFIPFAATRAEREAAGDQRPSIEERYPSKEVYVAAFAKAADALVSKRLLRDDDARPLVEQARDKGVRAGP